MLLWSSFSIYRHVGPFPFSCSTILTLTGTPLPSSQPPKSLSHEHYSRNTFCLLTICGTSFLSLCMQTQHNPIYDLFQLHGRSRCGWGGSYLDLIHISNPCPGLSKSLLERLDIGQVNRDVFCFMDYGLKCGWWMLLPKNNNKRRGWGEQAGLA